MSPGFSVGTSTALVGVARHRSGRQGCRALRVDRGAGRRGGFACAIGRVAAWQRDDTHEALAYGPCHVGLGPGLVDGDLAGWTKPANPCSIQKG